MIIVPTGNDELIFSGKAFHQRNHHYHHYHHQYLLLRYSKEMVLNFTPMFNFYTFGLLTFLRGIEMESWYEMV